jgi:hypothetical protein
MAATGLPTNKASSGNRPRDTAGRMLLAWAVLLAPLVILMWRIHLHPGEFEWVEYPTALGDQRLYRPMDADFFAPNLRFDQHPEGLFRRSEKPINLADERMQKVALDESGSWFVYQVADGGFETQFFLKTSTDRFMEFGARAHYQPFGREP